MPSVSRFGCTARVATEGIAIATDTRALPLSRFRVFAGWCLLILGTSFAAVPLIHLILAPVTLRDILAVFIHALGVSVGLAAVSAGLAIKSPKPVFRRA